MQLQDFDAALVARGFDGFQPFERAQMINLGYRYVARKYPYYWELANQTFVVHAGDPPISIWSAGQLGADNVSGVYIVSDPYRAKLQAMKQDTFERQWLSQDLTAAANRSTPNNYYVYNQMIYILPPPQTTISVEVFFSQFLPDMVAATDAPVTPPIMDEVILDASLVRAHRRAHELELANDAQARVSEAITDILMHDVWIMAEQQERVVPDDQWL
jgi:hypothetical protein